MRPSNRPTYTLSCAVLACCFTTVTSTVATSTMGISAWSYVITMTGEFNQDHSVGLVVAYNGSTGSIDFQGEPSAVLNAAIVALPREGGTLFLRTGVYVLQSPIIVNRSSVEIRGENAAGDLFFASDSFYNGFSNKTATLIIAEGFDAFQVGGGLACRTPDKSGYFFNGTRCLVLGIAFRDFAISGVRDISDAPLPNTNFTNGSGIRVEKADTIRFDNLDIRRKQYGLKFGQNTTNFPHFEYDHVIDVVTVNNLYLAYNQYGLFQDGWTSNVRIRNLFGYLNLRSLIHAETKYDWLIDGVMSQSDGNHGMSEIDAPIYITTRQDVTMRDVTIASNIGRVGQGSPSIPLIYIGLGVAGETNAEWYRGHIKLDTLTLFGTNSDAIKIVGVGFCDIHNLHAGSTGDQSFYGGPGIIGGRCVNAAGPETSVYVRGGYCNSNFTSSAFREQWMFNVTKVSDVRNFSPIGLLASPFSTNTPAGATGATNGTTNGTPNGTPHGTTAGTTTGTIGLGGSHTAPSPNTCYRVVGVEIMISSTGGDNVSIDVQDARRRTMFGGLSSLAPTSLAVGWHLCFNVFTSAPVVNVGGN